MPVLTPVPATPVLLGSPMDEPPQMSPAVPHEMLRARMNNIHSERSAASSSQLVQAEHMVKRSRLALPTAKPGENVAVPIPLVDRGRGDPRNILGKILNHDENDLYTICVKSGILKGTFARNQFDVCPKALLQESDVNQTRTITLRAAVSEESASGGQGYIKCNCAGITKCQSNRCKCFKSKMKCSNRCHNSLSCKNKWKIKKDIPYMLCSHLWWMVFCSFQCWCMLSLCFLRFYLKLSCYCL